MKFYRLIAIVLLFFIAYIPNDYTKKNGLLYKNNKPYTGKYKEFYENGNTKSIFNYLNGEKNGNFELYYETGEVSYKGYCEKNIAKGIYKMYYRNGNLQQEGNIINGKENGEVKIYFESGELHQKIRFSKGIKNGKFIEFYKNKKISKKTTYLDDKIHGELLFYSENGELVKKQIWNEGKLINSLEYND